MTSPSSDPTAASPAMSSKAGASEAAASGTPSSGSASAAAAPPHNEMPPEAHWDGSDTATSEHDGAMSDDEEEHPDRTGMLLLVWIHGFKGSATTTFGDFPNRLAHMTQATNPSLAVASEIYPTYDTRGSLSRAAEALVEWLTTRTVELECKPTFSASGEEIPSHRSGRGLGAGSVKVVLCGHSMGGLVAVDAALSIASSAPPGPHRHDMLWPRVCGVIAFDTPYYGVAPTVFKHGATKYGGYVQQAHAIGSQLAPLVAGLGLWGGSKASGLSNATSRGNIEGSSRDQSKKKASGGGFWSTTLMAGGALALAGGAAGAAWMGGGFDWVSDHFLFVSNLWDDEGLRARLDRLVKQPQIFFHALYNRLPPLKGSNDRRTFIVLPSSSAVGNSFEAVDNAGAADEVDAHTTMFFARSNSYIELGLRAAALVSQAVENEKEVLSQPVPAGTESGDAPTAAEQEAMDVDEEKPKVKVESP